MTIKRAFIILAILIVIVTACTAPQTTEVGTNSYKNISVETLETMLNERPETFLLVNVHIPFQGDIPGTNLSIPYNEITANLDQLPDDKNAEIVLYCRSDSMSNSAAADLAALGYTNVKNLTGGFNAWNAAGLPIKTEQ